MITCQRLVPVESRCAGMLDGALSGVDPMDV